MIKSQNLKRYNIDDCNIEGRDNNASAGCKFFKPNWCFEFNHHTLVDKARINQAYKKKRRKDGYG